MKKLATIALAGALGVASMGATLSVAAAHEWHHHSDEWHHHSDGGFGWGLGGFGLGLGLGLLGNPYHGYGPGYYSGPGYYDPYYAPPPSCWRWSHRWHRRIWVCG